MIPAFGGVVLQFHIGCSQNPSRVIFIDEMSFLILISVNISPKNTKTVAVLFRFCELDLMFRKKTFYLLRMNTNSYM